MQWPFSRSLKRDQLVFSWHAGALAYVQASHAKDGRCHVKRFGVERQGSASAQDFESRLAALGFKAQDVRVMLRPEQYQLLQIDTPAVAPEELRTAARWQIRDMVEAHMDDLTLDVIKVGNDHERAGGHLFVVAASNSQIRDVLRISQAMHCETAVIDVQDLAQRNLQSAWSRNNGSLSRAHASMVVTDDHQALLTICAHEELFYSRRIDLGEGFMRSNWGDSALPVEAEVQGDELSLLVDDMEAQARPGMGLTQDDENRLQRVVIEIQRSLDLWDRSWPKLVLDQLSVYAGARTYEMATWLRQQLGQAVYPLDVDAQFPGFQGGSDADRQICWPLLGELMRNID
jgi:MSHA biogenesis protein MshI